MAGDRTDDVAPPRLAPAPEDRVSFARKLAYGAGAFVNNLLAGQQAARTITLMRACDAFLPAIASAVAIWVIASYPITEQAARGVRATFEARRGPGTTAATAA